MRGASIVNDTALDILGFGANFALMKHLITLFTTVFMTASVYAQDKKPATPAPKEAPSEPRIVDADESKTTLREKTGYLGGAAGFATANQGVGPGFSYGANLTFFPQYYVGVGGLYRGADHGDESANLYGGELLLRPIDNFTIGAIIGGAHLSNAAGNTGTSFLYGGKLGYDFKMGTTPFSVGPEIDWVFFKPGARTISYLDFLAALKIWL